MSHRYSDPSVGEKSFLLLEKNQYLDLNSTSNSSLQKKPENTMENASYVPDQGPSPVQAHRIILSTESPAAQKLGTQQMIPRGLAIASKTKVPRHHSFAATTSSKELARNDPKRISTPDLCIDSPEDETEGEGTLKRNLRNQSYRVAMRAFKDDEYETAKPVCSLMPVSEDPNSPPPKSPGRSKKTFAKKRFQRNLAGSFKDDPRLYQEYRERGLNSNNQESDDDLLEENSTQAEPQPDDGIVVKSYRPAQLIWSQLPQVQESGILDKISPEERKRQEAIFEIITSEYSYQHSLDILFRLFKKSEELKQTINGTDHHHLFSNIADILEVSKRFFEDLEKRHKDNPFIHDISDIVEDHASNNFQPYVIYCSNEVYQQRTLQRLLTTNVPFKETLKQIEIKPECGGLPTFSFLILPMQRVTRLPLLMDTICQKTDPYSPEYEACTRALKAISKLVKLCNEGARKMERTEQMYTLQTQLEFGKIKPFPLISASRWLLKRGELMLVEEAGIFRKGFGRTYCYLFLFNDVLIITKKKSEESYTVTDYVKTDQYAVDLNDNEDNQISGSTKTGAIGNRSPTGLFPFRITMRKNSEGRQEQITLAADTISDRTRWITALEVKEENKRYSRSKTAELRQVEITKAYMAKQADEVSLQQADVVLVLQEEEGWYLGERLRDGERGWFTQSCAKEITNQMAVERNVKRMERLRIETDV
ncbi:rho guanine nucleotide exchange factor 16 [Eleutherodactylus coqui]|uniref:rho guanine nucleotide exchange factor 16 n=1 Tax=Eleutherodactylus coqui TaxID=57060 RepID=UPI003462CCB3